MTLGSIKYAREALSIDSNYRDSKNFPQGWKRLGQGGTRTAYLGPDNVVYKIQHDYSDDCNRNEVLAARRLKNNKRLLSQDVHIPLVRLIVVDDEPIVAMEYIDGKPSECSSTYDWRKRKCNCRTFGYPRICFAVLYEMLEEWGFNDCFSSNVFHTPDNKIWLIDLGYENDNY